MFRDRDQRWMVMWTLLGVAHVAHWIQRIHGELVYTAEGGVEIVKRLDERKTGCDSREFFIRLAAGCNSGDVDLPFLVGMNRLDYAHRAIVMGLLSALFRPDGQDEERGAIDAWLERYKDFRPKATG